MLKELTTKNIISDWDQLLEFYSPKELNNRLRELTTLTYSDSNESHCLQILDFNK